LSKSSSGRGSSNSRGNLLSSVNGGEDWREFLGELSEGSGQPNKRITTFIRNSRHKTNSETQDITKRDELYFPLPLLYIPDILMLLFPERPHRDGRCAPLA